MSMDDIAASARVTRRTLYYHFDSKDALFGAVPERQIDQSLRTFQKWAAPETCAPEEFIESLFDKLLVWSSGKGWPGSGFPGLSLELADLPGHPA